MQGILTTHGLESRTTNMTPQEIRDDFFSLEFHEVLFLDDDKVRFVTDHILTNTLQEFSDAQLMQCAEEASSFKVQNEATFLLSTWYKKLHARRREVLPKVRSATCDDVRALLGKQDDREREERVVLEFIITEKKRQLLGQMETEELFALAQKNGGGAWLMSDILPVLAGRPPLKVEDDELIEEPMEV